MAVAASLTVSHGLFRRSIVQKLLSQEASDKALRYLRAVVIHNKKRMAASSTEIALSRLCKASIKARLIL